MQTILYADNSASKLFNHEEIETIKLSTKYHVQFN